MAPAYMTPKRKAAEMDASQQAASAKKAMVDAAAAGLGERNDEAESDEA